MKHDQPCENEPAPQVPNNYVLWSSHLSPKNMSRPLLGLPFSLEGLSLADGFPGIIPKKNSPTFPDFHDGSCGGNVGFMM